MIGCLVLWKCFVACRLIESSQQPTCPHSRQSRRCTHSSPLERHSSHPSGVLGWTSRTCARCLHCWAMPEALPLRDSIQVMTAAPAAPATPAQAARQAEAFPRLTSAQIARIEPHGRRRKVDAGEILGEAGEPVTKIFVVVAGRLDPVPPQPWAGGDVPSFSVGGFTGERAILAGGGGVLRLPPATPPVDIPM